MKRFLLRLLLYLLPLLAAVAYYYLGVDHEALRGDLGRMTQTEFHYDRPRGDSAAVLARCRYVDLDEVEPLGDDELVVLGDSFSAENDRLWPGRCWHQYMGALVGKNIVSVYLHGRNQAMELLTVLTHCPGMLGDTVVVENVERQMVENLCMLDLEHVPDYNPAKVEPKEDSWMERFRDEVFRPVHYYQRRLGIDVPVTKARLDRELFSVKSTRLFYYDKDVVPHTEDEVASACNNLRRLDSLAHSKGVTLFFVAIPDKYTVYHRYLVERNDEKRVLEAPCCFDTLPCFVNLLPTLSGLVEKGVKDVYLPDDTHFSIIGIEATGRYVAARMKE